jgi:cellulose synthase/poly-beta-1,6-N-acetylglucosamine synthase-like glycosyltransferase
MIIGDNRRAVSIGVMAHNEVRNISRLLEALLAQNSVVSRITEIIVVSSDSTDGTDDVVRRYALEEPKIKLIVQPQRLGKAAAINEFIRSAQEPFLVLQSADTLPLPSTIDLLLSPFENISVGMTGARPVPTRQDNLLLTKGIEIMWHIHHLRNCEFSSNPKLGELVAFKRSFLTINEYTSVDEAEIEALIVTSGMSRSYCPEAIVLNDGPETARELFKQRFRIHLGNLELARRTQYQPLRGSLRQLVQWGMRSAGRSPKRIAAFAYVGVLEVSAMVLASLQFSFTKKAPYCWTIVSSGKAPAYSNEATAHSHVLETRPKDHDYRNTDRKKYSA